MENKHDEGCKGCQKRSLVRDYSLPCGRCHKPIQGDEQHTIGGKSYHARCAPPTIEEMSGLVKDFTGGKTMKEYMEELSDE